MVIEEIILSAFLQALFQRILTRERSCPIYLRDEVDHLGETLAAIHVVLDAAERRQSENNIKTWLQLLRENVYEANDLLDEVAYEDLRRQHIAFPKVRNSLLSKWNVRRQNFERNAFERARKVREGLDRIVLQSSVLNLSKAPGNRGLISQTASETSSVGDLGNVLGRRHDSEIILRSLLSEGFSKNNVDFIAILGKAGLGKTTLAQVVYNDASLAGHFHIKMWVHASYQDDNDVINMKALIKAIIESITHKSCDSPNLDTMQNQLQKFLEQKRYLLVLDAMVNDRGGFLEKLKNVLTSAGEKGSKVLITTQNRSVSKLLHTICTHEMPPLSDDDCLRVIKKFAFYDRDPNVHPDINETIKKIAYKCKGLPLAAKKYGMLLMAEPESNRWELISRKDVAEVLEFDYDVFQTLPSHIKRFFAYCSTFPHGFTFDKGQLIHQWMALDFVSTEEDGSRYFDLMFRWSLFRYSHFDYSKTQQTYVMDDEIHSRAKSIAGEECFVMHQGNSHKISKSTRHASFLWHPTESIDLPLPPNSSKQIKTNFQHLLKAEGLYTLIILARMQVPKTFTKLQRLRSLDLSNTDLHELPDSIADLKHLRYLALHNTGIKWLPNSLSELYHLQCLGLGNCYELMELPEDMRHLTNLQHLDLHLDNDSIRSGSLSSMPHKIGELVRLRTLSRFVVSKNSRCGASELSNMNDLHGVLLISSLELIESPEEARRANLERKENLQMVEFRWGDDTQKSVMDMTVLDNLRLHANIRELKIGGYRDCSLPSWIGDPSFSNLVTMKLYNCKNLIVLPPLGNLRSLKKLHIESLPQWSGWHHHEDYNAPSLRDLVIRDCINLTLLCPTLPVLLNLEIDYCPNLMGLPRFSSLHSLEVKNSGDWIWNSLCCLSSLSSLILSGMTTAPMTDMRACTNLWNLEISNCKELDFLPDDCLPTKLVHLKIKQCQRLRGLPSDLIYLRDLQNLQVQSCEELLFLPTGMQGLISLRYMEFSCCSKLSHLSRDQLPTGLLNLSINRCPELSKCFKQDWGIIDWIPSVWINGILMLSSEAGSSGASTS